MVIRRGRLWRFVHWIGLESLLLVSKGEGSKMERTPTPGISTTRHNPSLSPSQQIPRGSDGGPRSHLSRSQKHGSSVWTQRLLHDPVFPLGEPSRSSVLSSLFIFCMHGSAPLATRSPERALFCMGRAPPGLIGLLTPSDRPTGGGKAQAQAQARHGASQR
jgi:hypothetical protein